MSSETAPLPEAAASIAAAAQTVLFRVHFHDEGSIDVAAIDSIAAERQARAKNPGRFVAKIKRLRIGGNHAA